MLIEGNALKIRTIRSILVKSGDIGQNFRTLSFSERCFDTQTNIGTGGKNEGISAEVKRGGDNAQRMQGALDIRRDAASGHEEHRVDHHEAQENHDDVIDQEEYALTVGQISVHAFAPPQNRPWAPRRLLARLEKIIMTRTMTDFTSPTAAE